MIFCLSLQLASDEESVQSFNVEDSADHTGKEHLPNSADCHKPYSKAIKGMINSVTFQGMKRKGFALQTVLQLIRTRHVAVLLGCELVT